MCSQDARTFSENRAREARFSSIHVRAEGRGGEALLVEKVHIGHIRPAVADGFGSGHARGGDEDGRALDFRLRGDELFVLTGDGEAFELAAFRDQSAAEVLETEVMP